MTAIGRSPLALLFLLGSLGSYAADAPINAYDDAAPSKAFLACLDLKKNSQSAEALLCFADLVKKPNATPIQEKIYAYRMLADISAGEGDLHFARDILVHALKEIPDSTDLQFVLCRILYLEKKYETAIGVCNKGFSMLDPNRKAGNDLHLQALITVGDSYMELGKRDAAQRAYEALAYSNLQEFRLIGEKRIAALKASM